MQGSLMCKHLIWNSWWIIMPKEWCMNIDVNLIIQMWLKIWSFSVLIWKISEYMKVVEITMVQMLGCGGWLTTHLDLCLHVFTQNFYTISNFLLMKLLQHERRFALCAKHIVRYVTSHAFFKKLLHAFCDNIFFLFFKNANWHI